jgi:hypothetical protein
VAEWLRRGLQILPSRFDSGRGLHHHLRLLFLLDYCRLSVPLFSTSEKSGTLFVRLLFLAFLPHQQSHSIPGDPFLPRLFGVERGHVRVTPTKDRHELRLRCPVLGCNAGACLAQPVSRTIFEPSSVTPFPHAVAEARCREGLTVGRDQERQVATWPGIDRGLQLWQNWKIERYWTAITVLELGKVKPPILNMLAAKGDHVRLPLAGEQQKRKGKPRGTAWRMRRLELRNLFQSPSVMAGGIGPKGLHVARGIDSRREACRKVDISKRPFEKPTQRFQPRVGSLRHFGFAVAQHLDVLTGNPIQGAIGHDEARTRFQRLQQATFDYAAAHRLRA